MNKLTWPIEKLNKFDKNSRVASDADMGRLRSQIQLLGQYKPLLITNDGTVLGGNHRLDIYKELEYKDVWVSLIEFAQSEDDNLWYAFIDGEKQLKGFTTKESGMMEYSLSDNDRVAKYLEDELLENIQELELDEAMFNVDLLESTPLIDLQQFAEETEPVKPLPVNTPIEETPKEPEEKEKVYRLVVTCEDQPTLASLQEMLTQKGYKCSLS